MQWNICHIIRNDHIFVLNSLFEKKAKVISHTHICTPTHMTYQMVLLQIILRTLQITLTLLNVQSYCLKENGQE